MNHVEKQSKMTEVVKSTRNIHAHDGLLENPQIARPLTGQQQHKLKIHVI